MTQLIEFILALCAPVLKLIYRGACQNTPRRTFTKDYVGFRATYSIKEEIRFEEKRKFSKTRKVSFFR